MKKTIMIILAAICCLSLVGCKFGTPVQNSQTETEIATPDEAPDVPVGEKIAVTEPVISADTGMLLKYDLDPNLYARKTREFDDTLKHQDENYLYIQDRMFNSFDYFTTIEAVYVKRKNLTVNLCCYLADRQSEKAKEIIFDVDEKNKRAVPNRYVIAEGDYHLKCLFTKEQQEKFAFDYDDLYGKAAADRARALLHTPLLGQVSSVTDSPMKNSGAETDDIAKHVDVSHYLKQEIPNEGYSYSAYIPRHNILGLINTEEHYHPWYFCVYKMIVSQPEITVRGNEIEINGTYSDYNTHSNKFTAVINKDTGVLLSYVEKNGSGNVVEEIKTTMIAIDREIDQNVFDKMDLPE